MKQLPMTPLALTIALTAGAAAAQTTRMPISQVVGCLTQSADGTFMLTDATEPIATGGKNAAKEPDASAPLGKRKIRLIGTVEEFGAAAHKGHKVRVKGLFIAAAPDARLNITSLRQLATTCP